MHFLLFNLGGKRNFRLVLLDPANRIVCDGCYCFNQKASSQICQLIRQLTCGFLDNRNFTLQRVRARIEALLYAHNRDTRGLVACQNGAFDGGGASPTRKKTCMNVNRPLLWDFEKSGWQKGPKGRHDGKVRLEGRQDCLQIWFSSKTGTPALSAASFTGEGVRAFPLPRLASGRVTTAATSTAGFSFWERSASSEGTANEGVPRKIVFMG